MNVPNGVNNDPGQREGSLVYYCGDGYSYNVNKRRVDINGAIILNLRCKNYYRQSCRGSALVVQFQEEEEWFNGNDHIRNCVVDEYSHRVRQLIYEIKEACRTMPYERPRQLLDRLSIG